MPETRPTFDHLPYLRALRDELDTAFQGEERHASALVIAGRKRRQHRRWYLSASVVACGAAAAVVMALAPGDGSVHVGPSLASAADTLRQAARVAGEATTAFPRDDQYYYVHSTSTNLLMRQPPSPQTTGLITKDRRSWTSIDREGLVQERQLDQRYPNAPDPSVTPAEQRDAAVSPRINIDPQGHYTLGAMQLTRAELLALPTDPQTLYDRLRAGSPPRGRGHTVEGWLFGQIGMALGENPAPAPLRAALYRVLALIPGLQPLGSVNDSAGRSGTGVAYTETGIRTELIFDPQTADLLAERQVLVAPDQADVPLPAGTAITNTVYLERSITDDPNP